MSQRTKKTVATLKRKAEVDLPVTGSESGYTDSSAPLELNDYGRGYTRGREAALYDSPAERLKRLKADVDDLTESIAGLSASLAECEIKRENRLSAIRRIGTSLGF